MPEFFSNCAEHQVEGIEELGLSEGFVHIVIGTHI